MPSGKIITARQLFIPKSILAVIIGLVTSVIATFAATDPLPSWNNTGPKHAILAFVQTVTDPNSPDFVPPPECIATFDNDGTLWAEKPLPFQAFFAIDRVKALAPQHPEWVTNEPFAFILKGDMKAVAALGEKSLLQIIAATHPGVTSEEFNQIVSDWISTARHPGTGRLYTDMVYQPMIELLVYLRTNGFKTWIVSGGGIEFMRAWAEKVYGIPPEQVVGSSVEMKYEMRDGQPVLVRLPKVDFIDDRDGKPVGIQSHIGRRPIMAFGNSDGDQQMLEWTVAGSGPHFALLVHHDDAAREYAYDRLDGLAKLDKAWDEAIEKGWTVVSMKTDWKTIFP